VTCALLLSGGVSLLYARFFPVLSSAIGCFVSHKLEMRGPPFNDQICKLTTFRVLRTSNAWIHIDEIKQRMCPAQRFHSLASFEISFSELGFHQVLVPFDPQSKLSLIARDLTPWLPSHLQTFNDCKSDAKMDESQLASRM
jgi:hypothetical protein